jgi:hypothetical protein
MSVLNDPAKGYPGNAIPGTDKNCPSSANAVTWSWSIPKITVMVPVAGDVPEPAKVYVNVVPPVIVIVKSPLYSD